MDELSCNRQATRDGIPASCSLCRLCRCSARFGAAVRPWDRDRGHADFGDTHVLRDADQPRRGRRTITIRPFTYAPRSLMVTTALWPLSMTCAVMPSGTAVTGCNPEIPGVGAALLEDENDGMWRCRGHECHIGRLSSLGLYADAHECASVPTAGPAPWSYGASRALAESRMHTIGRLLEAILGLAIIADSARGAWSVRESRRERSA